MLQEIRDYYAYWGIVPGPFLTPRPLSTLRTFDVRLEEGLVQKIWCVLPEELHQAAAEELASVGHRLEACDEEPRVRWLGKHGLESVGGGLLTIWRVERTGRRLTLTVRCQDPMTAEGSENAPPAGAVESSKGVES